MLLIWSNILWMTTVTVFITRYSCRLMHLHIVPQNLFLFLFSKPVLLVFLVWEIRAAGVPVPRILAARVPVPQTHVLLVFLLRKYVLLVILVRKHLLLVFLFRKYVLRVFLSRKYVLWLFLFQNHKMLVFLFCKYVSWVFLSRKHTRCWCSCSANICAVSVPVPHTGDVCVIVPLALQYVTHGDVCVYIYFLHLSRTEGRPMYN